MVSLLFLRPSTYGQVLGLLSGQWRSSTLKKKGTVKTATPHTVKHYFIAKGNWKDKNFLGWAKKKNINNYIDEGRRS